jgi:hypothetical protein
MTAVTAFGSSVCNYTKGELLIHALQTGVCCDLMPIREDFLD